MVYSTDDFKKIQAFEKYARFICDHFDIDVVLDSNQAKTDGQTIYLPNIIGMNEEELDMMYSILLHEAGHIKFSTFTPEAFAKLKSKHHAYLANAIEDARIENLLMLEFGGAKNMFEGFYCKHAVNRKLMKKVFNIEGKRPDLFNCLGLYVHAKLLRCKTAAFSRVATRSNYIKIRDFVVKHNINNLLKNAKMKNWEDVLHLTNIIYDLFTQEFGDKSPKLNLSNDLFIQNKTEKILKELQQEVNDTQAKITPLENEYHKEVAQLDIWEKEHEQEFNDLFDEQRTLNEELTDYNNAFEQRKQKNNIVQQIQNIDNKKDLLTDKLSSLKNDVTKFKEMLKNGINTKGKPLTLKQEEQLQKNIEVRNKQVLSVEQKINPLIKEINDLKNLENELNKLKENKKTKDLSDENLIETIFQLKKSLEKSKDKENKLEQARQDFNNKINTLITEIAITIEQIKNKIMDTMYDLDHEAQKYDLPIDVLPPFEDTPAWPEADQFQQEFDEKASKIRKEFVRNGGRAAGKIGTNLQDLSIYIDNALEKVKNIDLLKIFGEKSGYSRLPDLNQPTSIIANYTEDQATLHSLGSLSKHTVLSKDFDSILIKNNATNKKEILHLLHENAEFIRNMKRVFALKFKFNKKDYFRGGQEEGYLDSRNIWKLPTNQGDDYFEINQQKMINKISASILIDISGSQDKTNTEHGKKLKVTALALSEAMTSVHINHEILGYHAPICDEMKLENASYTYNRRMNRLETVVYKTFMQRDNNGLSNFNLELSDNSDGESVRIALQRLKKERAKNKMLFILTDGKPFLSSADISILDEDLKTALREAVQQKIQIFAIGFCPNGESFYGNRFCHALQYQDIINFCKQLPI